MNDRFKFKFYSNSFKKIFDVIQINLSTLTITIADENKCPLCFNLSDGELIQCTGLKDKNGKLIYEGDIVKFKDNITINGSKTHIAVVEHNEAFNTFMYHAKCKGFYTVNKAQNEQYDIEVIGNKYENLELLKECE